MANVQQHYRGACPQAELIFPYIDGELEPDDEAELDQMPLEGMERLQDALTRGPER